MAPRSFQGEVARGEKEKRLRGDSAPDLKPGGYPRKGKRRNFVIDQECVHDAVVKAGRKKGGKRRLCLGRGGPSLAGPEMSKHVEKKKKKRKEKFSRGFWEKGEGPERAS